MRYLSLGLLLFSSLTLMVMACSPKPDYGVSQFEIGAEFDLGVGKTAKSSTGDLRVTLNSIGEDSRCPEGVNCMWAGRVVANVTVGNSEGSQTYDFNREGKPKGPTTKSFKGYKIRLHDVSPYPKEGEKIEKNQYTVRLSVVE